jgi:thiol-disulfide isomerase/thioredoxin
MRASRRRVLALPLAALALTGAARAASASRGAIAWTDVALVDGTTLRADTLRAHPVVVEFWASWCPFCARQNPQLQKLWEAQRARGLRMLTFSIDRDAATARAYLARHRYTFPVAMASGQSEQWFGARKGLPMLYVVGADGRIVLEEAGEMFPEDVAALARFANERGARGTAERRPEGADAERSRERDIKSSAS